MISWRAAEPLLSPSPEHEGPLQGQAVCSGKSMFAGSKIAQDFVVLEKNDRKSIEGDVQDLLKSEKCQRILRLFLCPKV